MSRRRDMEKEIRTLNSERARAFSEINMLQNQVDRLASVLDVPNIGRLVTHRSENRLDRLETEVAKCREATGYRLDELTETVQTQTAEINDIVAEHVGTEHEGLNRGLYRDLVARGIDPWEARAILFNNKGKT
jgi:hypothetical protein